MKYFFAFLTVLIAGSLFEAAATYPLKRCETEARKHDGQRLSSATFRLGPSYLLLPTGILWVALLLWQALLRENRESMATSAAFWFFLPLLGFMTLYFFVVYLTRTVTLDGETLILHNAGGARHFNLRQLTKVSVDRLSITLLLLKQTTVKLPTRLSQAGMLVAHLRETVRQNQLQNTNMPLS